MRTRPLGQSGIQTSVVALGTWVMGGWMWGGADEDSGKGASVVGLPEMPPACRLGNEKFLQNSL